MPLRSTRQDPQFFARFFGYALLVVALWGFWVARDVVHHADFTGSVPNHERLSAIVFILTWLVLFGPFAYFGFRILRRSFASEERSWLIPLRVFTYLVGRRFSGENQRREFSDNPRAKSLPPSPTPDYIDIPASSSLPKDGRSKTSE